MQASTITVERTGPGEFVVKVDGAATDIRIWNGSLGVSGRGRNTYGITAGAGRPVWVGSLQAAKKLGTVWASKRAAG